MPIVPPHYMRARAWLFGNAPNSPRLGATPRPSRTVSDLTDHSRRSEPYLGINEKEGTYIGNPLPFCVTTRAIETRSF